MEQTAKSAPTENDIRAILDIVPLAALIVDIDLRVASANAAACRTFGYHSDEFVGKMVSDLIRFDEPAKVGAIFRQLSAETDKQEECLIRRRDKTEARGEIFVRTLSSNRFLIFVKDISTGHTDESAFLAGEEERWRDRKRKGLERLAGGIAHDFNNILAVILLHTDMLTLQLAKESPLLHNVNEIKAVSNDAAGIVRQLLAFGRKQTLNPVPIVLNKLIEDSERELRGQVGDTMKIEFDLAPDLGVCFVDQAQVAQALVYLAINARDATGDDGKLVIETSNVTLDRTNAHRSQWGGSYVQMTITDNGRGMDTTVEDNIFDPFFSTKGSDKAAGLGLATVYGIIKQSGGFIWVESEIGRGTTFKIQFPRVDQPEIAAEKETAAAKVRTVLLVDDEQAVRSVVAEILKRGGLRVLEAESGMEAIEVARSCGEPIDLILTDFSMPVMDGNETARKVRELFPEIQVLFMSGDDIDPERVELNEKAMFISKPFSSVGLTNKVREMLGN